VLRIRCVSPGSWFLSIPDPRSRIQKQQLERGGKIGCLTCFRSQKYHKIETYFVLELVKRKIGPMCKELQNFLPWIFSWSSQNGLRSGIRDPGSGKNIFRIPDPEGWKRPRVRIRNTGWSCFCFLREFNKSQLPPDVLRGDIASSLIMVSSALSGSKVAVWDSDLGFP
jgi:hypothetical protein